MTDFRKSTDPGKRGQSTYSDDAAVLRESDAGLAWTPIGALGSVVRIRPHMPILFYNSSSSVAFISFSTTSTALVAPSSAANGIPVLPNSTVVYNSGLGNYVIASSSNVYGYKADDDSVI